MFLDRSAAGGRFPVQASVLARVGAILLGAGPGLLILTFLAAFHFGPQALGPHTSAASFYPVSERADGAHLTATGDEVAGHPYVETIRRMSRALFMRTTDTHLALAAASPSISVPVSANISGVAPLVQLSAAQGCILSARAPPQATCIL